MEHWNSKHSTIFYLDSFVYTIYIVRGIVDTQKTGLSVEILIWNHVDITISHDGSIFHCYDFFFRTFSQIYAMCHGILQQVIISVIVLLDNFLFLEPHLEPTFSFYHPFKKYVESEIFFVQFAVQA